MKKCAFIFAALLLAVSLLLTGGCSLQYLSKLSGSEAVQCLSVNVNLTNKTEGNVYIQTAVPVFGGFNSAKLLNSNIQDIVDNGIAEVKQAAKDLENDKDRPPVPLYFSSFFDYSENAGVLSTWITSENYTGGAHGFHWIKAFTVDMKTGESYDTMGSLFVDAEAGKELITDKIIAEIKKQPDNYFPEAVQTVKDKNGDFNFYLDGKNLVVYFDLYDITPYVAGIPVFKFPLTDLKTKIDFYDIAPAGDVRKNGMTIDFTNKVISNDQGIFLPLEETGVALSHSVLNTNGKYTVDGKEVKPTMINGVAYMPLQFFTETLGDFIIYDGEVLRMFTQTAPIANNSNSSEITASSAVAEKQVQNQMVYVKSFDEKSGAVTFDPIEWVSEKDAVRMKELKLTEEDFPNGYHIYNPSEQTESIKLSDKAKIRILTWTDTRCADGDCLTDKAGLNRRLKEDGALGYPYNLTIKGGTIVEMQEQYIS